MSIGLYTRMAVLFLVLTGLLMLAGYAIGLYFGDPLLFMLLGLVLAGLLNFVSYYWSDTMVVKMSGAKIIQESDNPQLFAAVRTVASKAGIPMPKVGIVQSPQPNAFATGRGPHKAVVVATSSILQALAPSELEAVIGHEIGHVVHRDVLTSSVAATMAGVISYIGTIALYSMMFGGFGGNNRQGGNPLALVAALVLVPLGATFVRLGISRGLEYNADEYGAKLTQNPGALASALQKISVRAQTKGTPSRGAGRPSAPSPATASLWIVNPFRGATMMELFSTHPSTQKRVDRLRKIGLQMGVFV
ncbi:MAG: M48 family metalloprotease [Nitrososphaerota archaeon]|nr:M48 family metalloprotease [Nitrososphaerota archaeon]MDG6966382.1 M48 family metalloprotease [Nitrososphaerota archaeon]MDG6979417.1 M48 family metalloprotease [Nitrososphaerota archaeon]MDG7021269.1 M48 family metalloprotease [Nitrososphaerota archaeon]MDG7021824.1 M48 family metalloprotease [Nitrososphaerota archaeon]